MSSDHSSTPESTALVSSKQDVQASMESHVETPASPTYTAVSPASLTSSSSRSIKTVSTATYNRQEQEAQDMINQRIEKLCYDLWPAPNSFAHRFSTSKVATRLRSSTLLRALIPSSQQPVIEHLSGGGFNHTTRVTLPSSYPGGQRDLIVRVPREDMSRPNQQVAVLNYVRQWTTIPVATVEASDFTCSNAVGKPYVIQRWIHGMDLASLWDDLSHSQRCVIAGEVGAVVRKLLSLEGSTTGNIEADPNGVSAHSTTIVSFKLTDARGDPVVKFGSNNTINPSNNCAGESTLQFFESCFARWRLCSLAENLGEIDHVVNLYDDMSRVVREKDSLHLFKPDAHCLCHLDLHPRNIMAEIGLNISIPMTGVLDWDESVVAPIFVNCQPPGWLWGYDKDEHTENSLLPWPYELEGANIPPSTPEQQELKDIFDSLAGPEYPRMAYDDASRLTRGLYRIATNGLTANWFFEAAERIAKEWDALRPSYTIEL